MSWLFFLWSGEEALSFGYGGTGKASTECQFKDYGESFTAGDVITAYLVCRFCWHVWLIVQMNAGRKNGCVCVRECGQFLSSICRVLE